MAPAPRPPPRVAARSGTGSRGPGFPFRGAAEMHRAATRAATARGWRSVPPDARSGTERAAAARMGGAQRAAIPRSSSLFDALFSLPGASAISTQLAPDRARFQRSARSSQQSFLCLEGRAFALADAQKPLRADRGLRAWGRSGGSVGAPRTLCARLLGAAETAVYGAAGDRGFGLLSRAEPAARLANPPPRGGEN